MTLLCPGLPGIAKVGETAVTTSASYSIPAAPHETKTSVDQPSFLATTGTPAHSTPADTVTNTSVPSENQTVLSAEAPAAGTEKLKLEFPTGYPTGQPSGKLAVPDLFTMSLSSPFGLERSSDFAGQAPLPVLLQPLRMPDRLFLYDPLVGLPIGYFSGNGYRAPLSTNFALDMYEGEWWLPGLGNQALTGGMVVWRPSDKVSVGVGSFVGKQMRFMDLRRRNVAGGTFRFDYRPSKNFSIHIQGQIVR